MARKTRTRSKNDVAVTKRTLKYLSVCRDPRALSATIRSSPDSVIRSICDAALNAQSGDVTLAPKQKRLFRKYRPAFAKLVNPKIGVKSKRTFLVRQRGGALPIIPILLSAVLSALGSRLFA